MVALTKRNQVADRFFLKHTDPATGVETRFAITQTQYENLRDGIPSISVARNRTLRQQLWEANVIVAEGGALTFDTASGDLEDGDYCVMAGVLFIGMEVAGELYMVGLRDDEGYSHTEVGGLTVTPNPPGLTIVNGVATLTDLAAFNTRW